MAKTKSVKRFRRATSPGQPSVDPASGVPYGAPPNLGRGLIPQVITFAGQNSAWTNVYRNPDQALLHSRENARYMRNDPAIMECLEARQRATALLNWHLEPEDSKDQRQADLVTDMTGILKRIPLFAEYRRNLLEALWYGRAAVNQSWGYKFVKGVRRRTVTNWLPIHGDKLVFRFDEGSGRYSDADIGIRVGTTFSKRDKVAGDRVLEATDWGMAYFLEKWERPLLAVHKHIIEDGAFEDALSAGRIHGVGIRDRIYWCWFQKQETMAHLMEVIERTGTGFTIYYFAHGNVESEAKMREVAEKQTKDNVILIPRLSNDEPPPIDRIEPTTAGIDALKGIIHEFFGWQIKRYILGQILSSESAATGLGSGVADLHQDTFSGIIQYDSVKLEETITDELVEHVKAYNFPWARNVHVRFVIDTKSTDAEEKLSAAKLAWDMGLKMKASDFYDLVGMSQPTEDDETLQNPAMQQQQRLWDQTHPGGDGSPAVGPDGQPAEPGSDQDLFGALAGGPGGDSGEGPPGPPAASPQQYAKELVVSPNITVHMPPAERSVARYEKQPEAKPMVVHIDAPPPAEHHVENHFHITMPPQQAAVVTVEQPAITVQPPSVTVEPPVVNVAATNVTVEAPTVNVAAPSVTVEAPNVTVETPPLGAMETIIERDRAGDIVRSVQRPITE